MNLRDAEPQLNIHVLVPEFTQLLFTLSSHMSDQISLGISVHLYSVLPLLHKKLLGSK